MCAQEAWAYTTGQPSPTQALAGRPLGAKPSLQELLAEEHTADSRIGAAHAHGISGRMRSKSGRPGAIIPPPVTLEGVSLFPAHDPLAERLRSPLAFHHKVPNETDVT